MKFLSAIGFFLFLLSTGAALYFSFFSPDSFMTTIWLLFGILNLMFMSAIIKEMQK